MTNDTTVDIQIIEKEIENAIDEKDLYRKKILKMYEEDKIIEKACKIKGSKSSAIAKNLKEKFSLIDNPAKIYEKVLNFKNYKDSYFESILLIRKEMIDSRNNKLFYSYLFMISHYIELVIKAVLLNKNNDLPSNHDILKIFTNDKDYLIGIGLKLDYYEYCEKQLKQIGEYAATNDFSMCFRFPFDKNYQSKIITKKMMNIKFSDIERIVNEQKYLFMIFEFMIVLSEKEFYKKVYDFSKNLLKEVDMYLEK